MTRITGEIKVERLSSKLAIGLGERFIFFCPGCEGIHPIDVLQPNHYNGSIWKWNGNAELPTFWPSIEVGSTCHSFINSGIIQFLPTCYHDLRGKAVPLPDLPDWV